MDDMLNGIKILVTRPEHQAKELCEMITELGGIACNLPSMKIVPPPDENMVRQMLSRISNYTMGIFISQNSVEWTLHYLGKESHTLDNLQIFAIGKSTARTLRDAGFAPTFSSTPTPVSEVLLELPHLQSSRIKGKRIIIFRGCGGRELLGEILEERGAEIDYAEVYQRVAVNYAYTDLVHIWEEKSPDYVVITSQSSLQFLLDMLLPEQQKKLLDIPMIVFGERLADVVAECGATKQPICVEEMTNQGILESIMRQVEINS